MSSASESMHPFRAVGMSFDKWKLVCKALRSEAKSRDSMAESPHTASDEARRGFRTDAEALRAAAERIEEQLV